MTDPSRSLAGRTILIVEDEYFIANEIARGFRAMGARIVGPASTVERALDLIGRTERIDLAVLDVNLQGEMVYPVAEKLERKGVRFVFATGYDSDTIPPHYAAVTRCEKPVDPAAIARALLG